MRHANVVLLVIVISIIFVDWTLSILILPERTEVTDLNEKYVYNVSARVIRYSRRSTYYYNLVAGLKQTWENNITVHMIFFEVQNNQYKRSLIEIQLKLCDLLTRDQYFGKLFRAVLDRFGLSCPFSPGIYRFMNVTLPSEKLPNLLPFQKGKLEVVFRQLPTQDVVGRISTIFNIKA